jgi:hypothetical protein
MSTPTPSPSNPEITLQSLEEGEQILKKSYALLYAGEDAQTIQAGWDALCAQARMEDIHIEDL